MKKPSVPRSHSHRVQFRDIRIIDRSAHGTKTINIKVDKASGEPPKITTSNVTKSKSGKITPQFTTSVEADIKRAK